MPTTPGGTGIEHTNVIWTESLPAATCYVARELEKQSHDQHRRNAKQLHAFLTSKNRQNLLLNCDDTPYTALGNIPDTTLVWVVYGFSVGTAGLGCTSPIDGKLLLLTGDGDSTMGPPSPLLFPIDTLNSEHVLALTDDELKTKLTEKGPTFTLQK